MRIISVDPGLTIGVAVFNIGSGTFDALQYHSVWEAEDWIWEAAKVPLAHLILEDYHSSGYLTKEANITLRTLGRLEGYMSRDFGFPLHMVSPQARLSSVEQATEMIGDSAKDMHRNGRDAIAALAHALSFAREHYGND